MMDSKIFSQNLEITNMADEFKVLLTQPLWPRSMEYGRFKKGAGNNSFSYGMASIAAVAENKGFAVSVLDSQVEGLSEKQFIDYLRRGDYNVIGMPCYTSSASWVFHTAGLCKKALPNAKLVVGGIHPTTLPEQTLCECPEIDVAVMGEGEYTFLDLLRFYRDGKSTLADIRGISFRYNGDVRINPGREVTADLDSLPMPAYHLFPMSKYVFVANGVKRYPTYGLVITRGCPFSCTFCDANRVHGKKLRHKGIPRVLEEIRYLQNNYRARGFVFQDSTFTINKRWVYEFCEALLEHNVDIAWACGARADTVDRDLLRKMRQAGCWAITFGLESGNQKSLDLIKKGTTVEQNRQAVALALEEGFYVGAMYILGLPGEDENDVRNTIGFARELGAHYALFFLPIPFPKTEIWESCLLDGGVAKRCEVG